MSQASLQEAFHKSHAKPEQRFPRASVRLDAKAAVTREDEGQRRLYRRTFDYRMGIRVSISQGFNLIFKFLGDPGIGGLHKLAPNL
jgi:hypothetical protein